MSHEWRTGGVWMTMLLRMSQSKWRMHSVWPRTCGDQSECYTTLPQRYDSGTMVPRQDISYHRASSCQFRWVSSVFRWPSFYHRVPSGECGWDRLSQFCRTTNFENFKISAPTAPTKKCRASSGQLSDLSYHHRICRAIVVSPPHHRTVSVGSPSASVRRNSSFNVWSNPYTYFYSIRGLDKPRERVSLFDTFLNTHNRMNLVFFSQWDTLYFVIWYHYSLFRIEDYSTMFEIMDWRRIGDKPFTKPMMT